MELLQRFPLPRRLSARLWLLTLPSGLLSFERRQRIPRMPIGRGRFLGLGLVAFFGFLIAYPLTGGAMNLARVFGTDLVANQWTDFGAYWLGLIGGAVAGLAYEYLFAHREEEEA